ncbi:universal stress protein [Streptomyces sp. B6B3]|uniref:universal stress protein n=1 Tax=Streptomyces sp. B6B3 TaxID=3153570 RepID=UPI00325C5CA0
MERPVVVGVDGSDSSLLAVDWALDASERHGRPLRMVHASLWERYEGVTPSVGVDRPTAQVMAHNVLAAAEHRAAVRRPGVALSQDVLAAGAVESLLEEGRSAFLLVVGCRGRGPLAGALLGSVSLGVAGRAPCPTVVVRGSSPSVAGSRGRVVVGVDGTPHGAAAVGYAFREAEARGCELLAVHAWRRPGSNAGGVVGDDVPGAAEKLLDTALDEDRVGHPDVPMRRQVVEGSARQALLRAAEEADLLVVGAHQRRGAPGLHLGLVSHALLHQASCPVAVVPQP